MSLKSQECGQSATHDGIFIFSPAMVIAAMGLTNTLPRNTVKTTKIGPLIAEISPHRGQNIEHVELSIAAHRMRI